MNFQVLLIPFFSLLLFTPFLLLLLLHRLLLFLLLFFFLHLRTNANYPVHLLSFFLGEFVLFCFSFLFFFWNSSSSLLVLIMNSHCIREIYYSIRKQYVIDGLWNTHRQLPSSLVLSQLIFKSRTIGQRSRTSSYILYTLENDVSFAHWCAATNI